MNRYVFYILWCDGIIISSLLLYNLLLNERFNGSMMAIVISAVSGMIFLVTMTKSLEHFPKQGLPEIFRMFLPAGARVSLLIFFSIMTITKGCIMIGYASSFFNLYLSDLRTITVIAFMFLTVSWGATRSSKTILSTLELVLFICIPIMYFILTKAVFSQGIEWNSIKAMDDYALSWPKWETITAANSLFSGFVGLIVFNRVVPSKIKWKFAPIILIVNLHILVTGLLISIGIHGTYGVGNYISPMYSALDSIGNISGLFSRTIMPYFLIVLFLLLMYAAVTIHVGLELLKGCFSLKFQNNPRKEQLFSWTICCLFTVVTMIYFNTFTLKQIKYHTVNWLELRFYTEFLMVALVALFAVMKWRRRA